MAAHLPGYRVGSVTPIGSGLDNVAYDVNGELIVRFQRKPDPSLLDREARLLAAVAAVTPVPVPEPVFTAPGYGCLAYRKLPGTPLLDLPRGDTAPTAHTLGRFLAALHGLRIDFVVADVQPLIDWRREAAELYPTVAAHIPPAYRRRVEAFLGAPPPEDGYPLVFSHNDLGIEHVLVDPDTWTVTGVLDWSDAALVDPAYDFGLLFRDLGPGALRAALDAYGRSVAGLADRAAFYARCSLFEDLAYGIETGRRRYVDKSLTALEWLFPHAIRR